MVAKKSKRRKSDGKIVEEIEEIERWIIERRKFFFRLGWVALFISILLILSNLYLKVGGIR